MGLPEADLRGGVDFGTGGMAGDVGLWGRSRGGRDAAVPDDAAGPSSGVGALAARGLAERAGRGGALPLEVTTRRVPGGGISLGGGGGASLAGDGGLGGGGGASLGARGARWAAGFSDGFGSVAEVGEAALDGGSFEAEGDAPEGTGESLVETSADPARSSAVF